MQFRFRCYRTPKIALNIVGRDKTTQASLRARRKKAAWNDAYMLKLLVG